MALNGNDLNEDSKLGMMMMMMSMMTMATRRLLLFLIPFCCLLCGLVVVFQRNSTKIISIFVEFKKHFRLDNVQVYIEDTVRNKMIESLIFLVFTQQP